MGLRAVGLAIGGVDEHQVDVGAVVELAAAQLSERDDGHAALASFAVLADVGGNTVPQHELFADAFVTDVQNGVREMRHLFGGVGQRAQAQNVAQQDAQNLLAAEKRSDNASGILPGRFFRE